MCVCPSSKPVTRSKSSCTSISRVSDSTTSCGALGLTGETEIPLMKHPTGDGSGDTLETLEIVDDSPTGVYGCSG